MYIIGLTKSIICGMVCPMKKTTKHNIYEVWCDYTASSVFLDHKPTKKEVEEIRRKQWPGSDQWDIPYKIIVFKLKPFYTK